VSHFFAVAHSGGIVVRSERSDDVKLRLVEAQEPVSSLDQVYRRYCRYVAAVILRLDGRATEVDDLVQDVFVEAARGIGGLRQPGAIKGWLATIAVRVVRRRLRLRRLRRFLGLDVDVSSVVLTDASVSPVDRLLLQEVYRVLDELSVDERLAFSLHYIEGEKMEAVAKLCGCSFATAKRRVARAQRMIEKRLSDA
jgi:RNA polymerase sigma-70 factor, ECF subfamily